MVSRDQIVNEIKRTATENHGVPLGRLRFYTETGIRETDWTKYWPRWSDAVREAGLVPNEKTISYQSEVLLEKLVSLIRELGKFPTAREIKLKSRNDPGFPADKTFRRFGTKGALVAAVVAYCRARDGHDDIVKLCAGLPTDGSGEQTIEVRPEPAPEDGFVYLLRSGRYYKIGKSNAVGRRERELAIQLPDKAKTVHVIRTDDPHGIEAYWHQRFDAKRKNGEWFDLGAADIAAFRRRKFM